MRGRADVLAAARPARGGGRDARPPGRRSSSATAGSPTPATSRAVRSSWPSRADDGGRSRASSPGSARRHPRMPRPPTPCNARSGSSDSGRRRRAAVDGPDATPTRPTAPAGPPAARSRPVDPGGRGGARGRRPRRGPPARARRGHRPSRGRPVPRGDGCLLPGARDPAVRSRHPPAAGRAVPRSRLARPGGGQARPPRPAVAARPATARRGHGCATSPRLDSPTTRGWRRSAPDLARRVGAEPLVLPGSDRARCYTRATMPSLLSVDPRSGPPEHDRRHRDHRAPDLLAVQPHPRDARGPPGDRRQRPVPGLRRSRSRSTSAS